MLWDAQRVRDGLHVHVVAGRDGVPGPDRLGEVIPGVEEEHGDSRHGARRDVRQHPVAHRCGDDEPVAERVGGPPDHLVGSCVREVVPGGEGDLFEVDR